MNDASAADQDPFALALLTMGKALAPRLEPGDAATPPMPSAILEALKMAHLSGQDLTRALASSPSAEDRAAEAYGPAPEARVTAAEARIKALEANQARLADAAAALDARVRELEAKLARAGA